MSEHTDEKQIDQTTTLGFGLPEALDLVKAEADADQASATGVGGYEQGPTSGTSSVGTGMADRAGRLTDVDLTVSPEIEGNTGTWRSDNPAGTGAGVAETGATDAGWERDNDANQIDVNMEGIQHINLPDANEGGTYVATSGDGAEDVSESFAYADNPDRTPEEE